MPGYSSTSGAVDQQKEKHSLIWSQIIQTPLPDIWMLLGPHLQSLYSGKAFASDTVYLALVCLEWEGDLQYQYSLADLRAALAAHEYNEDTCEARLSHANIVVNIWSWAKQDDATAVTNLYSTLLTGDSNPMQTYVLLNHCGSLKFDAWDVWMAEHWEADTVMTEEQYLFDGIAALAGRRCKGRFDVSCPIGRSWCFFEWDGQRSVDGLGKYSWFINVWREHEGSMKYGKSDV
ncbi:hypothetical protein CC79DRAFT_1371487 [Sarocladium strictum]